MKAGVLRARVLPYLVRRALTAPAAGRGSEETRETQPLVNVAASLLTAALLTLLAYARPAAETGSVLAPVTVAEIRRLLDTLLPHPCPHHDGHLHARKWSPGAGATKPKPAAAATTEE
ncbi:hypothetical protein ABT187_29795 [Streptomyces sp. NPDC001817]|uniref:hypothetical protein n=1 Tax=Streptomyces sp. NPDC001817 TaxID=3154398 RepID=UPI00332116AB